MSTPVPLMLGYSARATHTPRNETVCRDQLIRRDIDWPISTDPMVWPTVFDVMIDDTCFNGGIARGNSIQDLWGSLDDLRDTLAGELSADDWPEGSYQVIAVALMIAAGPIQWPGHPQAFNGPADRDTPDPEWELLGFDVSDEWLLSGLSNCLSRNDPDFGRWEEWWDYRLNEHGLFKTLDDAREFVGMIDDRVKEHAPFHPYAIWKVE
jgi:hypothetical protein